MWGMNVPIPHFPGGPELQFWWIGGVMVAIALVMLAFFRRNDWI
jgi:Mg2+ and Co2+ transporter CorA